MSTTDTTPGTGRRPSDDASALEKQLEAWAPVALPIGTALLAGVTGWIQGPGAAVLVLAGGTLVGIIALFWSSLRTLFGETPLSGADAYALGAPRAEEEQKRSVLRALKDVEFERTVGKISADDYQVLVGQYRAEAKRLLRLLDDDAKPQRDQVEALVQKRLRLEGLVDAAPEDEPASEASAAAADKPLRAKKKKPGREADEGHKCPRCKTRNDADAMFCKKCGARRSPASASPVESEPVAAPEAEQDADSETSGGEVLASEHDAPKSEAGE